MTYMILIQNVVETFYNFYYSVSNKMLTTYHLLLHVAKVSQN